MNEISRIELRDDTTNSVSQPIQTVLSLSKLQGEPEPSMYPVLDDVKGIVSRVISASRADGRDYVDQCRLAARAVVIVRPDLSIQDTLKAIFRLRERDGLIKTTANMA